MQYVSIIGTLVKTHADFRIQKDFISEYSSSYEIKTCMLTRVCGFYYKLAPLNLILPDSLVMFSNITKEPNNNKKYFGHHASRPQATTEFNL